MMAAEFIAAIKRLRELERTHALPEQTLRDLDSYIRSRIFDEDSDLLNEHDRRQVQDAYIDGL